MKKLVTATISTCTATALLLGVGGTLAFWNRGEPVPGEEIVAGTLEVRPVSGPTFTRGPTLDLIGIDPEWGDTYGEPMDIETYRIVPRTSMGIGWEFEIEAEGGDFDIRVSVEASDSDWHATLSGADAALRSTLIPDQQADVDGQQMMWWGPQEFRTIKHRGPGKKTYRVRQWNRYGITIMDNVPWLPHRNENMRGQVDLLGPIVEVKQLPPSD